MDDLSPKEQSEMESVLGAFRRAKLPPEFSKRMKQVVRGEMTRTSDRALKFYLPFALSAAALLLTVYGLLPKPQPEKRPSPATMDLRSLAYTQYKGVKDGKAMLWLKSPEDQKNFEVKAGEKLFGFKVRIFDSRSLTLEDDAGGEFVMLFDNNPSR